jgi:hypothetical protein
LSGIVTVFDVPSEPVNVSLWPSLESCEREYVISVLDVDGVYPRAEVTFAFVSSPRIVALDLFSTLPRPKLVRASAAVVAPVPPLGMETGNFASASSAFSMPLLAFSIA